MTLSAEPPAPSSTNGSSVASPTQRVVPGAPPPAALTKNQIRKRKQKASVAKLKNGDEPAGGLDIVESPRDAALVDHVPSAIIDTLVAGEDEVKAAEEPVTPAAEKAPSPIIDQVLNKRIKHFSKKLVCLIPFFVNDSRPDVVSCAYSNVLRYMPQTLWRL